MLRENLSEYLRRSAPDCVPIFIAVEPPHTGRRLLAYVHPVLQQHRLQVCKQSVGIKFIDTPSMLHPLAPLNMDCDISIVFDLEDPVLTQEDVSWWRAPFGLALSSSAA
jgi:hypothetical protein